MKIDVKHIQKRGKSGWRYRRKIPEELRAILGKREILIPLGPTEAIAIKKYPAVHAEAEKLLLSAISSKKAPSPNSHQPLTPLDQFKWGQQHVRRLQLDPEWSGAEDEHDSEALHREVIAEQIAAKYPIDERGNPIGVSVKDAAALRALMYGARQDRPDPTLEDAKRLYLKERVGGDETKQMELERVSSSSWGHLARTESWQASSARTPRKSATTCSTGAKRLLWTAI
ncbi:MAG: hypothetical protein EOQ55_03075 [Mesorhizobium sp.]|uniref:hypothetical protein n=1 Tax=Mesorhizobium sp. TaxID=1871066 RepID=UPI000FE8156D|nr:hypothetical protein [Mesorhizobium sp.]RWG22537.1 MAG: hypothetical protein EOQ55_03075 [Mesorhizobium sp.]